jgi:hypothetical protein
MPLAPAARSARSSAASSSRLCLHEAIAHNPVRELDRIEQPKGQRRPGRAG